MCQSTRGMPTSAGLMFRHYYGSQSSKVLCSGTAHTWAQVRATDTPLQCILFLFTSTLNAHTAVTAYITTQPIILHRNYNIYQRQYCTRDPTAQGNKHSPRSVLATPVERQIIPSSPQLTHTSKHTLICPAKRHRGKRRGDICLLLG